MKTLENKYLKLENAVCSGRSNKYCLTLWSDFIRTRDEMRCVICESAHHLSAHHIIRKSFWKHLKFQTGNGITLCHTCHKEPHIGFNRRPDLNQPMDAEGGEKIDLFTGYLGALAIDSKIRNLLDERFYYFDDHALNAFKKLQGISEKANFKGRRIEQAYNIWSQTPRGMLNAIMKSLGVTLPEDYIQEDRVSIYLSETHRNDDGSPAEIMHFRFIPPTNFKTNKNT
ncbi:HNH endonuclease [Pseudomonas mosselii]|uniref:HNH endonuclease n=1 Tax=Pseudomonas mosselii TaxID=78327 RepID=UPI0016478024|nr:HNH endonuclease [Pseudomonas mosselii]MBC3456911.1 HNH endonuclease [Pseudomonas mosselii]